jgi:type IV pilus assembly protein PilB
MIVQENQLKEFLLDSGLITEADYEGAVAEALKSKNKLTAGHVLINNGKISENDFRRAEAYVLGIPFVSLKDQKIDPNVLALIPEPVARKNNAIAFKRSGDTLEVAMLDTRDLSSIEFIKKKVGLKILPRLTDSDSIKSALLQYQKSLRAEFGDIIQKDAAALKNLVEGRGGANVGEDLKKMA